MKHRKGKWVAAAPARENASRELPLFAAEYFALGRKSARKGVRPEKLHEFRLATKHFRYLLELFRPLYGDQFETFFHQLRAVQTVLGELNDYAVTREMLRGGKAKKDPELDRLFTYLKEQRVAKNREFRRLWRDEFDVDGAEERWVDYLAKPVQRTTSPRKSASR